MQKPRNRKKFIPKFRIHDKRQKDLEKNNPCLDQGDKSKSFIRLSEYREKSSKIMLDSLNSHNCFLIEEEIKKHLSRLLNQEIDVNYPL